MRLLHAIRSVNPAGGGPIEGIKQLAEYGKELGQEVEIVSLDDPKRDYVGQCSVQVHALGPGVGVYGYSRRLVPWLEREHRNYDIVIANGIWQYNSFAVWRVLRHSSTPYFVYTHGMLDPWFKRTYPLKHLKKWLYWPWAEYRVLRDAKAVIFTCAEEPRLARESFWLYRCNEQVLNYGTAGIVGDASIQRRCFEEKFPHLSDKDNLLFLGRVHVKKGPDLLLRAFARVRTELPPAQATRVHLIMAGPDDHEYGRKMKSLVAALGLQNDVTWTGMLQGDLKWGAFRVADAFVLPSHQENFGIAVAEALSAGVPVLLGKGVNIWPDIEEDGAGLVAADSLGGTVELLFRWFRLSAEERARMRRNAISCFRQRYTIRQAVRSLNELILWAIARRATLRRNCPMRPFDTTEES